MGRKDEITGSVGAKPPADAPIETAQPLDPLAQATMQDRARRNEKTLAPFKAGPAPAVAAPPTPAIPTPDSVSFFDPPAPEVAQAQAVAPEPVAEVPPLSAEDRARMPAASDSDTPAKGLLPDLVPPIQDKFEGIDRGGFVGDFGDGQYFPMDGSEVLDLCNALLDTIAAQIKNDLRFSMALTYPRVRVTATLKVECFAEETPDLVFEKVFVPKAGEKGSTPEEVAIRRADDCLFVVQMTRQEVDAEGNSVQPPDAIREELGRDKPRHQYHTDQTGRQSHFDLPVGSDVRAVTR